MTRLTSLCAIAIALMLLTVTPAAGGSSGLSMQVALEGKGSERALLALAWLLTHAPSPEAAGVSSAEPEPAVMPVPAGPVSVDPTWAIPPETATVRDKDAGAATFAW